MPLKYKFKLKIWIIPFQLTLLRQSEYFLIQLTIILLTQIKTSRLLWKTHKNRILLKKRENLLNFSEISKFKIVQIFSLPHNLPTPFPNLLPRQPILTKIINRKLVESWWRGGRRRCRFRGEGVMIVQNRMQKLLLASRVKTHRLGLRVAKAN